MSEPAFLTHPLLVARGVAHGFGLRSSPQLPGLLRPRQVHGSRVAVLHDAAGPDLGEADAVVSDAVGAAIAVATADCVPVLATVGEGRVVAAIHAGWRGLAAGVVAEAVASLRHEARRTAGADADLVATIGPHIGSCCYEVDEPVLGPLRQRFGADLAWALRPTRPQHALLDLAALVRIELLRGGVAAAGVGVLERACTHCDARRFHSFRRDGSAAGRLLHWICPRGVPSEKA